MPPKPPAFDFSNTPISERRPGFGYAPKFAAAPVVSIVTPFYNTGAVFHATAQSLLQQSLQQWEWLIVNDGSTEPAALAILEDYRHCDSRIQVIDHPTNQGLPAARNTGFKNARAAYVAQLDSDDLLEPTALEKWAWFLESYPEYAFVKGYSVGFGAQEYLWEKGFSEGRNFLKENLVNATALIRKSVHAEIGSYDETLRTGLEDWDYWLRYAHKGRWGATIPEFQDWYRRKPDPANRWESWDGAHKQNTLTAELKQRYPDLWQDKFPDIQPRWHLPHDSLSDELPFDNILGKTKQRLLMVLPWMGAGGADKFNLDVVQQLAKRGWELTLATTLTANNPWWPEFSCLTPDTFVLSNFLRLVDYPRFLRYLIQSRQIDAVYISNSELGYLLLPYLRAHFPNLPIVDMCHMEEPHWKNGGYPRVAVDYQELVDLNIVSSQHLRDWMVARGAKAEKIRILYTGVDTARFRPDPARALDLRNELNLKPGVIVILYAARLTSQKQPRVFAQVMHALQQRQIKFVALVAGDGPEENWLRHYVADHNLRSHVRLLGLVSNDTIRNLMLVADVFFLPSEMEGIALSIYEALASGLPVVSAQVGGQAELVTPDCGFLVEHGENEVTEYTEILARLAAQPDERKRLGLAGRQHVEKSFRLETMVDQFIGILSEAEIRAHACPAPLPSPGLAYASAAMAIEYTRLFYVAEELWNQRERRINNSGVNSGEKLYITLQAKFMNAYQWGLDHNWTWLKLVKDGIKSLLLRS